MGIVDKVYYRIMAMASDQKIVLDQNAHGLKEALDAVNIRKVYDLSILGLDPNSTTDDRMIHKKLKKLGATTPNSSFLFITKNSKHFKSPDGYDVLWIPDKFNPQFLSEAIKQLVTMRPKESAQGIIFQAQQSSSKLTTRYTIRIVR